MATRNLEIDHNLFYKLIFQIIERSKFNIYLIVKALNYLFVITGKFLFYYCKLTTIYTYYPSKSLIDYLRATNFYLTKLWL